MKHVLRQLQTGHIVSSLLYIILGSALPVMIGWMDLHRGWAPVYGVSCVYAESGEEPPGDGSRLAEAALRNAWSARRFWLRATIMTQR